MINFLLPLYKDIFYDIKRVCVFDREKILTRFEAFANIDTIKRKGFRIDTACKFNTIPTFRKHCIIRIKSSNTELSSVVVVLIYPVVFGRDRERECSQNVS